MFLDSVLIDQAIHGHLNSVEKKNLVVWVDTFLSFDLESDFLDGVIGAYGN
jgi:hypothetical protein